MCSLHLTHPSLHTWSSGQPTVQRPGSSRGLPVGAGIRTHNLGLPRVSSPTLYPLGQRPPLNRRVPRRITSRGEGGVGTLEASRDLEAGQVASRAVPIPGPRWPWRIRGLRRPRRIRALRRPRRIWALRRPRRIWALRLPWWIMGLRRPRRIRGLRRPWRVAPPPKFSWGSSSSLGGAHEASQVSWTGPAEAKVSWAGPAEAKVSWTGPAEAKVSWTGPAWAEVSWTGPAWD